MANQVLSSGEPVFAPSPCRGPCAYKIPFSGPRFHCEISPDRDGLIPLNKCNSSGMPLVYRAEDKASFSADPDTNPNSFVISWYEDVQADGCGLEFQQTMDCSITLADYQVEIETFQDQSRKFSVDVEREEEIWTKDNQIYTSYWEWFLPYTLNETESLKEFLPKFRAAQTFAISRAATSALQGDLGVGASLLTFPKHA